jgi:glycosyltransferase involved in cell wall biosynthesis
MLRYSVIVPAHNEQESLPRLLPELAEVMGALREPYEVIVVDDGSTDGTVEVLAELHRHMPALRCLRLNGNYGQSTAFEAGFRAAKGEILITMDADGQNPPAGIPILLEALNSFDAVCGRRRVRNDSWLRRTASRVANSVRRAVLKDGIHDTGCSLKAFRRECVERLKLYRGMHRFLPALVQMEGYRVTEVLVDHRPREAGKSHYGIWNRLLGPLVDLWAVRWMQRRYRPYHAAEHGADKIEGCTSMTSSSAPATGATTAGGSIRPTTIDARKQKHGAQPPERKRDADFALPPSRNV